MADLTPDQYAARYGPTTGDIVRLGDADLFIEVERDDVAYGDELTYGWAGTLRPRALQKPASASRLDAAVIGALVVDPVLGIVKTSLGVLDGRIVSIGGASAEGEAHDVAAGIGPYTDVIDGTGLIATPGAIDAHVHLITPRLLAEALASGVTSLITAGWEEPLWKLTSQIASLELWPLNVAFQATVRSHRPADIEALATTMGCAGLKVHEDFGADPELIDAALTVCEDHDIQLAFHTDGLGETTDLAGTLQAIGGRTAHAYHVEGAGGGHVDLLTLAGERHILCSSTNPTVPFGPSTVAEHVDMIALVHGRDPRRSADASLIGARVRAATMAAEGPLHDLGAIQMVSSDSQGMGRIGETVRRTWQLAHVMKHWAATPDGLRLHAEHGAVSSAPRDNDRVLQYLAKLTIEPAIVHGIAGHVGTLAPGRLADIVLWRPALFGVRPELVIKAGRPAYGPLGSGNATVTRSEPVRYGPHWAAGGAAAGRSVLFTSAAAEAGRFREAARTARTIVAVKGCRRLAREQMRWNRACVPVQIDPTDGRVTAGGIELRAAPVTEVPLSRRYLL